MGLVRIVVRSGNATATATTPGEQREAEEQQRRRGRVGPAGASAAVVRLAAGRRIFGRGGRRCLAVGARRRLVDARAGRPRSSSASPTWAAPTSWTITLASPRGSSVSRPSLTSPRRTHSCRPDRVVRAQTMVCAHNRPQAAVTAGGETASIDRNHCWHASCTIDRSRAHDRAYDAPPIRRRPVRAAVPRRGSGRQRRHGRHPPRRRSWQRQAGRAQAAAEPRRRDRGRTIPS